MKKIVKLLFVFVFSTTSTQLFAQVAEMADTMRSEGKIYVVVAILLVILLGLITFLVMTDRKVSKLEKRLEK